MERGDWRRKHGQERVKRETGERNMQRGESGLEIGDRRRERAEERIENGKGRLEKRAWR